MPILFLRQNQSDYSWNGHFFFLYGWKQPTNQPKDFVIHGKYQIDSDGDRNLLFKGQMKNDFTANMSEIYYRKITYRSKMTVEFLSFIDLIFL